MCNEKKEKKKKKKPKFQTKIEKCYVTNICKVGSSNGTKRLEAITLLSLVTKNEQNFPYATIHSIPPFIILETNKQTFLNFTSLHSMFSFVWKSSNHHCNVHIACFYYIYVATIHVMRKNVKVHDLDMGSCFASNSHNVICYENFPFMLMQKTYSFTN